MPGKIDAPLNKKLQNVEWGMYKIADLFEKIKVETLNYKAKQLPSVPKGDFVLPALTAGIQNQGLNNYVPLDGATILKNVISISANGANTGATFFQSRNFTVLQDAYAIKWKDSKQNLTRNQYLFLVSAISKAIYGNYAWTNKAGWERIKNDKICIPVRNGEIDFDFMESFIAELETQRISALKAYLYITGLSNIDGGGGRLTEEEKHLLANFNNLKWGRFNLCKLFGKSTRGRRLKSADRIPGNLPFVTAGEAETGVSAYIGNSVEVFSKNTVTIDMFGSAKYRNYDYGCDDHIAVVHTENLSRYAAIFITSAVHKSSHNGQFNYGNNFYPKDADSLDIMLPVIQGQPDFNTMETIISAIHKLVIKDVIDYAEKNTA